MKFKPNFERDWQFYLDHKEKFTFCGENVEQLPLDPKGKTAKECFHAFDSTGEWLPCKEPELLKEVIRTKKAINFQIKQWVEGWYDVAEPTEFYLAEFNNPPDWVILAIDNQRRKHWHELAKKQLAETKKRANLMHQPSLWKRIFNLIIRKK